MTPSSFLTQLKDNFQLIQAAGFITGDEIQQRLHFSSILQEELDGIIMRLYFSAMDPEKKIHFFINQYDDNKFLYFFHVNDGTWLFVISEDQGFAKLHFFIKYLLSDSQLDEEPEITPTALPEKSNNQISAARRIQDLLLVDPMALLPDFSEKYFWYSPKEEIGGDFYWGKSTKKHTWLVVGDCTGHSVEGALATVSVLSLLNQLFDDNLKPHLFIKSLHHSLDNIQQQNVHDGYGISHEIMVMKYNHETHEMWYSGTGLPLYLIRNSVKRFKTKRATFDSETVIKYLRSRKLVLQKGDGIFTHSDGLIDQFNEEGRRLKSPRLVKNIKNQQTVNQQTIEFFFQQWRGAEEQTDDAIALYFKR